MTKTRHIKAEVRRNGIVLYSDEIPEVAVLTSFKDGKEEATVIKNKVKYEPWIGMDSFSKLLVCLVIGILVIMQLLLPGGNIKHKIYNILIIITTIPPILATLRQIYFARKHEKITKMKTSINKVLYEYETNGRILFNESYKDVKPYEIHSGFIIVIKIGIISFICWTILIPNVCMVHPWMSLTFAICVYFICIRIAVSNIGDIYLNFLQRLISWNPDPDVEYYKMAKEALKNYEKVADKIGHSHEELVEKLLDCFEKSEKLSSESKK